MFAYFSITWILESWVTSHDAKKMEEGRKSGVPKWQILIKKTKEEWI